MNVSHAAFVHIPGQFINEEEPLRTCGRCQQQRESGLFFLEDSDEAAPFATPSRGTSRPLESLPPAQTTFYMGDFFGVDQDIPVSSSAGFNNNKAHITSKKDQIPQSASRSSSSSSIDMLVQENSEIGDYGDFYGLWWVATRGSMYHFSVRQHITMYCTQVRLDDACSWWPSKELYDMKYPTFFIFVFVFKYCTGPGLKLLTTSLLRTTTFMRVAMPCC